LENIGLQKVAFVISNQRFSIDQVFQGFLRHACATRVLDNSGAGLPA